jgi:putative hydrolase of the HAD superfamily
MCAAELPPPDEIEAVLFDLDDTLVDARGGWRAGFAEAIAELHAESPPLQVLGTPEQIYDAHFRRYGEAAFEAARAQEWESRFTREAFERLLAEHLRPDSDLAERLHHAYLDANRRHMSLHAGAMELLEQLGARYPLGLVSNGPRELQRPKVEMFMLEHHFEVIVISGEVGVRKPDREIFELALGSLGVDAGRAVYVGDNPAHDVVGACGSGLAAIWVNRGDWPAESLDRGSDAPLHHAEVRELTEVPRVLGL